MHSAAPLILALLLSGVVLTDIQHGLIRNWNNLALFLCGLGINALGGAEEALSSLLGSLLGGGSLLCVSWVYRVIKKRDGIGMGDIKFMLGAGTWVLPHGVAPLLMMSSLIALFAVAIGTAPHTYTRDHIAFGPFLSIACFAIYCLQEMGWAPWAA